LGSVAKQTNITVTLYLAGRQRVASNHMVIQHGLRAQIYKFNSKKKKEDNLFTNYKLS
jgi:hypothetical protein